MADNITKEQATSMLMSGQLSPDAYGQLALQNGWEQPLPSKEQDTSALAQQLNSLPQVGAAGQTPGVAQNNPAMTPSSMASASAVQSMGSVPPVDVSKVGAANVPMPAPLDAKAVDAMVNVPAIPLNNQSYAQQLLNDLEARKSIETKKADILSRDALAVVGINDAARAEDATRLQEQEAMFKKVKDDVDARDQQLRALLQKEYASNIDPERWWNSKSTGGKILAGIGMILGGFGGGLAHTGRNPALEQINRAIDADIASQKSNIEKNFKVISELHGLDNDAFNRNQHELAWKNNFRMAALEHVKLDLATQAAKSNSEMVKQNAKEGILKVSAEQNEIRNKLYLQGVAAAQASAAQLRALQKDAQEATVKVMEKDGVDYETAEKAVYSSPRFRGLVNAGMGPVSIMEDRRNANLKGAAETAIAAKTKQLVAAGVKPEFAPQVAREQVYSDPMYAGVKDWAPKPIGVVVPKAKTGGETEEQVKQRTVNVTVQQTLPNGQVVTTTMPRLAANKKAADDYKEYSDSAPDVEAAFKDMEQAFKDNDRVTYNQKRAQLMDSMPKFMLGSGASGPTIAQAHETYGTLLPEFGAIQSAYKSINEHAPPITSIDPETITKGLNSVKSLINSRKETMERNTFADETPTHNLSGGKPVINFTPKK